MTDLTHLPPQNHQAELAVCGVLLTFPEYAHELDPRLKPDDFFQDHCRDVFRAFSKLRDTDTPIDSGSILDAIRRMRPDQTADEIIRGFSTMMEAAPHAGHLLYHSGQVIDSASSRRQGYMSLDWYRKTRDPSRDPSDTLAEERRVVTSIVIPAHNEAGRIGGNLALLTKDAVDGEFEIIVVPNGCTDATVGIAAGFSGVKVIALDSPSKADALRAGDAAATRYPRIYLDADVPLTTDEARSLARSVVYAATGQRRVSLKGAGLLVRAFYAVNRRLPAYADALYGRGVIALSEAGRARFDEFPDQVADDLFLDSLFTAGEKNHVDDVVTTISVPRSALHLARRLARVRAGNSALRNTSTQVRAARNSSWLRHVVLPRPWLWPAGLCYAAIILYADALARRTPAWGQP